MKNLYHIGYNSNIRKCRNTQKKCKFGRHFKTVELAEKYLDIITPKIEKEILNNHSLTPSFKQSSFYNNYKDYYESMGIRDKKSNEAYSLYVLSNDTFFTECYPELTKSLKFNSLKVYSKSKRGKILLEKDYFTSHHFKLQRDLELLNKESKNYNNYHDNNLNVKYTPIMDIFEYLRNIIQLDNYYYSYDTFPDDDEIRVGWDGHHHYPILEHIERSYDWISVLNPEEQDAVGFWTNSGFRIGHKDSITKILHENSLTPNDLTTYMNVMDSALQKINKVDNDIKLLWRGIKIKHQYPDIKEFLKKYPINTIVSFDNFSSCSEDTNIALNFSDGIIFEILTQKSASVSVISSWGTVERENLLPRNVQFKVHNIIPAYFTHNNKPYTLIQLTDTQ